MTRILIKEFSKWAPGNYEVDYGAKTENGIRIRCLARFETKRAAYIFAENEARNGRNASVYRLEED